MCDLSGVSPPTPPTETLRSLLERIREDHYRLDRDWQRKLDSPVCVICRNPWSWPCPTHSDAVAAIALLDAASSPIEGDGYLGHPHVRHRLVPDAVGRPETGNNT